MPTTGTGYTKTQMDTSLTAKANTATTYTMTATNTLLDTKEPSFITVYPVLKNLIFETGNIELILDSEFTSAALAPVSLMLT